MKMGEARHIVSGKKRRAASPDVRQLLTAIAQAKKSAVVLHEEADDDLPGKVGDIVLLSPSGKMTVAPDAFMRRAALVYLASKRFVPGLPKPKTSSADIPRAKRLVAEMREALRTRDANEPVVWAPPNYAKLAATVGPAI